jgi:hypothetical protein
MLYTLGDVSNCKAFAALASNLVKNLEEAINSIEDKVSFWK